MPPTPSRLYRWSVAVFAALGLMAGAPALAQPAALTASVVAQEIVSLYLVTVQGEARQRKLQIMSVAEKLADTSATPGAWQAEGRYGWADAGLVKIQVDVTRTPAALNLRFTTPTTAVVVADRQSDGSFAGTITLKSGTTKPVTLQKVSADSTAVARTATPDPAQQASARPVAAAVPTSGAVSGDRIRFIHMGGNDCPPCVAWRGLEFPKLEKSPVFQSIKNSYVVKAIRSPIPAELFLPAEVKPLKSRLERASAGKSGSPHQMLLVDGEVYDYWFGTLDATQIEARIAAITGGMTYPGPRCTRLSEQSVRVCAEPH